MTHKFNLFRRLFVAFVSVALCFTNLTQAQTTSFTYQGRLSDGGNPANGSYDIQFKLFDALTDGNQIGTTITNSTVQVSAGIFTVELDFGAAAFDGTPRYLEICVRPAGSPNPYTLLSPRQAITSIPYAMHSANAAAADGLSSACAGCVTDTHIQTVDGGKVTGNIAGTQISGTVPVESVPQGSGNYIQNSAAALKAGKRSLQQEAGFNIDGDGIIGGNLGIGTTTPAASLHVASGISWFQGDGQGLSTLAGKGVAIGYSGTVDRGYLFAYDYATGSPRNLLLNHPGGNVGIGTLFPQGRLHVHHPGNVGAIFLSTGSGTEGAATFRVQADSGLVGQGKSFVIYSDDAAQYRMVINGAGNVGFGTTTPTSRVDILGQDGLKITGFQPFITLRDANAANKSGFVQSLNGDIFLLTNSRAGLVVHDVNGRVDVRSLQILGGSDLSESFDVSNSQNRAGNASATEIQPGIVVTIDPDNPGKLVVSRRVYDRRVAGIISGAGGIQPGMTMGQQGSVADGKYPVALSGRVWVYCDASKVPIRPGDLLTTSATAGHAMKVSYPAKAQGAIIGKAMTGLKTGRGLVLVLVSLQ